MVPAPSRSEGRDNMSNEQVKPLRWLISAIAGWNGDYHTVPPAYTVRCAGRKGWKWQGKGARGYAGSAAAAKAAAQAEHDARIQRAHLRRAERLKTTPREGKP